MVHRKTLELYICLLIFFFAVTKRKSKRPFERTGRIIARIKSRMRTQIYFFMKKIMDPFSLFSHKVFKENILKP